MDWLKVLLSAPIGAFLLWKLLAMYLPWLPEDVQYIKVLSKMVHNIETYKKKSIFLYTRLLDQAREIPNQRFILFENETVTFNQMLLWTNKCCRALHSLDIRTGDKIALFMHNEPAFLATWLGCSALGGVTAFLNTNLRLKSLLHCIDLADIKLLVVSHDEALLQAVAQVKEELNERNIKVYVYGKQTDTCWSFSDLVEKQKSDNIPSDWCMNVKPTDPMCFIYTSGTTGLPKAVNIDYHKCWSGAMFLKICKIEQHDVVYTALPLYHTAAALIAFCGVLENGCALVLRRKFSASHFWPDCRKYNVTVVQYIGEILRYVCAQPATPDDLDHKVRLIVGNGLRPDVWRTFLDRYGHHIHVMEFYAATESNVGFINFHNIFGCVGTFSPLIQLLGNGALIKFDPDAEEIIRDENGFAIKAGMNEPALLVGMIAERYRISSYKGNRSLTEKKVLTDVFKRGDKYFNTGDLLMFDKNYHVHFCDRVGDTYRWKGENVSTNEVSDIVVQGPGISEANVYGVEVKGSEGRAGMATVVLEDGGKLDCKGMYDYVCEKLPFYARPIFLRVAQSLELTGTLKQRKVNLKREGFDLNVVKDSVYFLDGKNKAYVPFTAEIQKGLEEGSIRA